MKSIINYLLILAAVLVVSCKKDEGNYSYHNADVALIDTTGLGGTFTIEQNASLRVAPVIGYKGDTANLSYEWLSYVKSLSSYTIGPPKLIASTRVLDGPIKLSPGNYYLELVVTDKVTRMKTTTRFFLNVLAYMESGWLVMHSKNNETDLDFIVTKNIQPTAQEKRLRNLFETNAGAKLKGNGQMLGYSRRSNSDFNWITIGTSQELRRMQGFAFTQMAKDGALFRRPEAVINPQAHMNNSDHEMFINNGLLYPLQWTLPQDAFYSGSFRGDYYLAPFFAYTNYSPLGIVVYDQKNLRFLYTTGAITNLDLFQFKAPGAGQSFDLNNVGKDLMFMDRGMNNYAYAFFKDKTGNGRYLYILNISKPDDGLMGVAAEDMSALPEIANAKYFQVGSLGNVALYATDRTIYRYDYSGTKLAYVNFAGFGAGETITGMKIFKSTNNVNNTVTDFNATNNTVVFVSTWDGTQGRVYELGMNLASGIINPTPLHVYDGFGKIGDMVFKFRGTGI